MLMVYVGLLAYDDVRNHTLCLDAESKKALTIVGAFLMAIYCQYFKDGHYNHPFLMYYSSILEIALAFITVPLLPYLTTCQTEQPGRHPSTGS